MLQECIKKKTAPQHCEPIPQPQQRPYKTTTMQQQGKKYYVSITGLRLKSVWHYLTFVRHAMPCYQEAQSTPGNVFTGAKLVDGVQHTLTGWESKKAMIHFKVSAPHRQAMAVFPTIATGKTYGYWTDEMPNWDEALSIWHEHGVEYTGKGCPHRGGDDTTTTTTAVVNEKAPVNIDAAAKTCPCK
jgi:hypothetical protein